MYSLKHKLYISQRAENQQNARLNVGFVYSLYSFFVSPLIYVWCKVWNEDTSKKDLADSNNFEYNSLDYANLWDDATGNTPTESLLSAKNQNDTTTVLFVILNFSGQQYISKKFTQNAA